MGEREHDERWDPLGNGSDLLFAIEGFSVSVQLWAWSEPEVVRLVILVR